jgi:hypothetical protein
MGSILAILSLIIVLACFLTFNEGLETKAVEVDHTSSSMAHEYKRPLTAVESHYGSLRRLLDLPITGMNETCTVGMCDMLKTALSCKGIGYDMSKTCAEYILGFLYECPGFPAPSELFDAPYTCVTQIKALLPPEITSGLGGGGGGASPDLSSLSLASLKDSLTNVHKYMLSNFTENCERRCFQQYVDQANSFWGSCHDEMATWTTQAFNNNTRYPTVWLLYGFQEFRNQVCAKDEAGTNCFSKVQKWLPTYYNGTKAIVSAVDIFDHDCNYYNDVAQNQDALQEVCQEFADMGCCFGNAVAMMAQDQTNQSAIFNHNAIKEFPPCLLRFLKHSCGNMTADNALDPVTFCNHGTNGDISVLTGSVQMGAVLEADVRSTGIVNVYDREDLITFEGTMAYGLLVESIAPDNKLTTSKSLWVEITDYAYYSEIIRKQSEDNLLTPTDGGYPVDQSDYHNAKSMTIQFQIVLSGYDYDSAVSMLHNFTTRYTCGNPLLKLKYDNGACINVTTTPLFHQSDPVIPTAKSISAACPSLAGASLGRSLVLALATVCIASMLV